MKDREFKDSVRSFSYGNDLIKYLHNFYNSKKDNNIVEDKDIDLEIKRKDGDIDDFL